MRKMRLLLTLALSFLVAGFYSVMLLSVPIELNKPIMLRSIKFDRKTVWTHAWSRNLENNAGEVGNHTAGRSKSRDGKVAAPENHHELLIGVQDPKDIRDKDGNQFYIIQSVNYPERAGNLYYNEPVKIYSVFSGAGIKKEAGLQKKPRLWWVHHPARLFPDYCEIVVSLPETKHLKMKKEIAHFEFVSPTNKTGAIQEGDAVKIKSLSGESKSQGAFLFVNEESRWGKGFMDVLIRKGDSREMSHSEFEIRMIDKSVLTVDGKEALDDLFFASGYTFLKLARDIPTDLRKAWSDFGVAQSQLSLAKSKFEKIKKVGASAASAKKVATTTQPAGKTAVTKKSATPTKAPAVTKAPAKKTVTKKEPAKKTTVKKKPAKKKTRTKKKRKGKKRKKRKKRKKKRKKKKGSGVRKLIRKEIKKAVKEESLEEKLARQKRKAAAKKAAKTGAKKEPAKAAATKAPAKTTAVKK